jgi:iron complex transport system ATP-binding protein
MIEVQNISVSIGTKHILEDISTQIENGKVTAILGPNGAGKTTLLKCLAGTIKPDAGTVTIDEMSLADYSLEALAKKRAVLSQSNPINFPFTAHEIVMMGRNPYGDMAEDRDIVQEALKSVDAWHLKDRIFPTLSGGEQQRIQLARVLAQIWQKENSYLFLDEPTSALDLKHQHLILSYARNLSRNSSRVITILHDINLAMAYADQVILLKEGRILAASSVESVLTRENIKAVFEVELCPNLTASFGITKNNKNTDTMRISESMRLKLVSQDNESSIKRDQKKA